MPEEKKLENFLRQVILEPNVSAATRLAALEMLIPSGDHVFHVPSGLGAQAAAMSSEFTVDIIKSQPLPTVKLTDSQFQHIQGLILNRKKIEAIKEIRSMTCLGLKAAKDLVEGPSFQQPI